MFKVSRRFLLSEPIVDPVSFERRGSIFLIKMNRPECLNAVNKYTADQLYAAFRKLDTDKSITAGVITSTSNNFCSGYDLKELANMEHEQILARFDSMKKDESPMGPCRMKIKKPLVAAIEGACVAGGLELALMADIRIGAESSYYGLLNRRYGVPLIDGGTVRLPAVVGHGRAVHLAMTGERIECEEAERIGLITKIVPNGSAIEAAVALAKEISKFPDGPLANDKNSLYRASMPDFDKLMDDEFKDGRKQLKSAIKNAKRFYQGHGRHGDK